MRTTIPLTRKITTLILASIPLFLGSCKKEASGIDVQEFASVSANADAEAEVVFDNVFDNVMGVSPELGIGGTGIFGGINLQSEPGREIPGSTANADTSRCFTTTLTKLNPPQNFPLQVVIDFGAGCTAPDGRTRKGKIITVYTGPLFIPDNSSTTTFDGYYVNEKKVEGTHKTTNKSTPSARVFNVTVTGAKLTRANGTTISWNSDKTISQTEGLGTPLFPLDDVFKIEGGSSGSTVKDARQFDWSTNILEPLVKKFSCRWIVKGVVKMQRGTERVAELNYGDGTCDNKATITSNGETREISLQ